MYLIHLRWVANVEVRIRDKVKINLIDWYYPDFQVYRIIKVQIILVIIFLLIS